MSNAEHNDQNITEQSTQEAAPSPSQPPASQENSAPAPTPKRKGPPRPPKKVPFNPMDELDAVDRLLLAIEFANGVRTLSNRKLKEISRLPISVENISARRKRGCYIRWLDDHSKGALEMMEECQSKALRVLREQMDDKQNPKLRQKAALFFAAPALEARMAKVRRDAERQSALETFNEVQRTEVTVVWQNSGPTFGDPPAPRSQQDSEPQGPEPFTIDAQSRALPSPQEPSTPSEKPAVERTERPAPQSSDDLSMPGVLDVGD